MSGSDLEDANQEIVFTLNGKNIRERHAPPNTTLLEYLRGDLNLCGTKEGCAEGDCGACTVVLLESGTTEDPQTPELRSVNSCLLLLPLIHGRQIWTVEGLAEGPRPEQLHPCQRTLAEGFGSQCGYCTPGVVMSLASACYRRDLDSPWKIDDQMSGNLCRCTGYGPIRAAAESLAGCLPDDKLSAILEEAGPEAIPGLEYQASAQSYFAPDSWPRLFEILSAHPERRFVLGATDLGLEITKLGLVIPCLISLHALPGISGISELAGSSGWRIGAGTSLARLESELDLELPTLSRMLRFFGSRQIKNRGTIGGNLCNASPIGDLAPVLLSLSATLIARGPAGERRIPIDDFFTGYRKTALRPDEVLAAVEIPRPHESLRLSSYKVSKRREMDISAVAAAFAVGVKDGQIDSVRIAFGGMAATPARARATEAALLGKPFTASSFEDAALVIEQDFQPLSDHRGSAWYRKTVARNLVMGFFDEVRENPRPRLADRPTHTLQSQGASR